MEIEIRLVLLVRSALRGVGCATDRPNIVTFEYKPFNGIINVSPRYWADVALLHSVKARLHQPFVDSNKSTATNQNNRLVLNSLCMVIVITFRMYLNYYNDSGRKVLLFLINLI